jgi:hypothetical protein
MAANPMRCIEVSADRAFALRGKTFTTVAVLAANTVATVNPPALTAAGFANAPASAQAKYVLFSGNADFFVAYDQTIASGTIPAATSTAGTSPELNPTMRIVSDVTNINIVAGANTIVTMMWFQDA